jgi:hypothetical protein
MFVLLELLARISGILPNGEYLVEYGPYDTKNHQLFN